MNSLGMVVQNFEWDYEGPISIVKGTSFDGKGVSRTMFLSPADVNAIPEQLFAVKISQSKDPEKAGKCTFKYFSYRFNENQKFTNLAPTGCTLDTELSAIKADVISKFNALAAQGGNVQMNPQMSINVNLHGKYTNVTCADGTYAIYDEERFPHNDPNKVGDAPYYIKKDAIVNVHLKGAVSQGNEYLQSTISTVAKSDEIFQKAQAGKVWGEDDSTPAPAPAEGGTSAAGGTPPVW